MANYFDPKMHKDEVFTSHKCEQVPFSTLNDVTWFPLASVRKSLFGRALWYCKPLPLLANHVIWGSDMISSSYEIGGVVVDEALEALFNLSGDRFLIYGLRGSQSIAVQSRRFSFELCRHFLHWNISETSYLVVIPESRIVFYRDESAIFSVYCRDSSLHKFPFGSVEDDEVSRAFWADSHSFKSELLDSVRIPHLTHDVLPFTMEGEFGLSL